MQNIEVRNRAQKHSVKLWEIAHQLGITDATFSRKLRFELPDAERDRILTIIDEISKRKQARTA